MKISAEIPRRAALAALLGIPAGLTLHHVSKKLGLSCSPFPGPIHHETQATQTETEPPPLIHGPDASLPELTLDQATGLIALHGLRITWASLRMFGKCIAGVDDCIGGNIQRAINALQSENFRSFHIFGTMTFDQMATIQNALLDQTAPPLVVSADQEGGPISRLGWMPQLRWISANMLVRSGDINLAEEAGYITGQLLHLNGINLNLAPFVDLHAYEPGRRFSDNSREISLYAQAYVQGLIKAHIGSCAKHFPDGSPQNPHNRAGIVNLTLRELQVAERYQPLINAGLPAIMVGHDIFTQVDPGIPVSISKRWITNILREEMGFEGLIVTDSLGMTGLMHEVSSYEEAILRAFQAGADLLMANGPAVRNVLTRAVSTGEISRERVNESARRILMFSQQFPIVSPAANKAELERSLMQEANNLYHRLTAAQ